MKTMYRLQWSGIKPVNVVKETDKMVEIEWVDNWGKRRTTRQAKANSYESIHETFAEAKAFLIEKLEREKDGLTRRLERITRELAEVRELGICAPPKSE